MSSQYRMIRFAGALFFNVLSIFSFATSITVTGPVAGTWSADTVIVQGNLVINEDEQLIINPGTLVQFQGYYKFEINGSLVAEGQEDDTIYFTIRDTSQFHVQLHGRGGWSGIRFSQITSDQDSSRFSFCRFQYAKATEDSLNSYGGAFYINSYSKIKIENCLFYHNYSYYSGGAIFLKASDIIIRHCVFKSNYAGNSAGIIYGYGGGICSMNSSPDISWNDFYENSSTGVGGGVSFDYSNPKFNFNIMIGNYSGLGGALGVLRSSPSSTLSNNLISGNAAMFFGGGICCIRSFPVFSNLTIADNMAAYGGGFYCNDSAAPKMYNSIIWNNTGLGQSVYIWDIFSAPSFYYCNIEGDSSGFEGSGGNMGYHGEYLYNINEDPGFYGLGSYPYMLIESSPCIDSGTPDALFLGLPDVDLVYNPRITYDRIDMGVYEYNGTTSSKGGNISCTFIAFPNPFSSSILIALPEDVNLNDIPKILIYNAYGTVISQLSADRLNVNWDGCDSKGNKQAAGVYFISLIENGRTRILKVIKR